MPSRGSVATLPLARRNLIGWLVATAALFMLAEVVGVREVPRPETAAVAAAALRIGALLATLTGVAGYARRIQDVEAHRLSEARAEQAHEARSALAAIEHAARALDPGPSPLPLADAIVSEVAVIRRLFDPRKPDTHYAVAEALLGPVTVARLAGAAVEVTLEDGLTASGDPSALAQIAQALLDNARRHAPGAAVIVRARREGDRIQLVIQDDGPGIDPALANDLFSRGVRSSTGGGSGLGLAAAAGACASQGGRLSLIPGSSGAAFLVDLPAAAVAVSVV